MKNNEHELKSRVPNRAELEQAKNRVESAKLKFRRLQWDSERALHEAAEKVVNACNQVVDHKQWVETAIKEHHDRIRVIYNDIVVNKE